MLQHKGTCELKSERMKLRRFILSDAKSMYKNYATDERVTRFLSWTPYVCVEDVESFLQSVLEEYNRPDTYHWAIEVDGEIKRACETKIKEGMEIYTFILYIFHNHFVNKRKNIIETMFATSLHYMALLITSTGF